MQFKKAKRVEMLKKKNLARNTHYKNKTETHLKYIFSLCFYENLKAGEDNDGLLAN